MSVPMWFKMGVRGNALHIAKIANHGVCRGKERLNHNPKD